MMLAIRREGEGEGCEGGVADPTLLSILTPSRSKLMLTSVCNGTCSKVVFELLLKTLQPLIKDKVNHYSCPLATGKQYSIACDMVHTHTCTWLMGHIMNSWTET